MALRLPTLAETASVKRTFINNLALLNSRDGSVSTEVSPDILAYTTDPQSQGGTQPDPRPVRSGKRGM